MTAIRRFIWHAVLPFTLHAVGVAQSAHPASVVVQSISEVSDSPVLVNVQGNVTINYTCSIDPYAHLFDYASTTYGSGSLTRGSILGGAFTPQVVSSQTLDVNTSASAAGTVDSDPFSALSLPKYFLPDAKKDIWGFGANDTSFGASDSSGSDLLQTILARQVHRTFGRLNTFPFRSD